MSSKTITLIAALGTNRAIGLDGKMPWHLPGELKHFKEMTMGKPIVMGSKTWKSLGRVLPGRQNIVLTRRADFLAEGCDVVECLGQAIAVARGEEIMVIGGGVVYQLAMPMAKRMILTQVECTPEADTWFPDWDRSAWIITSTRSVPADENNPYAYQVQDWTRI